MSSENYSEDLLRAEYQQRAHIRSALQDLKQVYGICDGDVAELGSGLGYNLEIFAEDSRTVGVEVLRTAADSATNRGIRTVVADLGGRLPLDSGKYDLVLCMDVLEHLLNPAHCVEEAHRILKPEGLLVINVPNHFSLAGRLKIVFGSGIDSLKYFPQYREWNYPHVRFFRHASSIELLSTCNFQIEADWSARFPSIPILNKFGKAGFLGVGNLAASSWPNLFASGFFLVARRMMAGD